MTIEPEEIIESRLVELLVAAVPGIAVVGMLAPSAPGTEKTAPDTRIAVTVDLGGQQLDWKGPGPFEFSIAVAVRFAEPDDPSGVIFRDTCRAVRGVLDSLLGDDCARLNTGGFECDSFMLGATSTTRESVDDSAVMAKTYPATVIGRFVPTPNNQEQEA